MMRQSGPLAAFAMHQSNSKRPVIVLQITDTHLHADAAGRMRGVNTLETLLSVLEAVRAGTRWPPDAIVVTGDIVQDESRAGYERFRDIMAPLKIPVFCIPGNHDDPALMAEVLAQPPFQVCGDTTIGDWTLVFLDSSIRGEVSGRVDSAALKTLDTTLTGCSNQNVLVCLHHQPLPMGSTWLDGVGLEQADRFLSVVERHKHIRGILWGHVHQASDRSRSGIRFLSTPSTCAQFLPDSVSFALDDRPPGARWLILESDGQIDTDVQWLAAAP
jgi:3',5'-cyclic-AMP phosphodiesterase